MQKMTVMIPIRLYHVDHVFLNSSARQLSPITVNSGSATRTFSSPSSSSFMKPVKDDHHLFLYSTPLCSLDEIPILISPEDKDQVQDQLLVIENQLLSKWIESRPNGAGGGLIKNLKLVSALETSLLSAKCSLDVSAVCLHIQGVRETSSSIELIVHAEICNSI